MIKHNMANKKGSVLITIIVVVAVFLLGVFYTVMSYNRFVSLTADVDAKWSEVENQYQRQADLIPNLVSVVSSSVKVETTFVKDVVAARNSWQSAKTSLEKDSAGVAMNNGVAAFVNAVAESYPVLAANKQYVALTDELAGTQNRITVARGRYIQSIQDYNIATKKFPSKILAGMFGFSQKEYYKADSSSMGTPKLGTGQLP